jgi:hypothetical protein
VSEFDDEVSSRWPGEPEPAGGFPVVCENGCPNGYLGDHKFSCRWAGRWFLKLTHEEVKVCGHQLDGNLVCVQIADRAVAPTDDYLGSGLYTGHQHVCFAELSRTRYPSVKIAMPDLSGPGGNIFAIIGQVADALQGHGEAVISEMTDDIFSSHSYTEALVKVGQWVTVL